ncbi:hypothetical protein TBK1r_05590 [Stieleria magnilauensis]|uniref:Uncharacterized protein n=1 Tax=Stieleria magnilauensis TaxID=2527963 RepID=A0ABX5XKZ6_9BACT|nr:hypothetical protein TBK1r_05590 [Planctomycetes bacterium TBK1r]
MFLKGGFLKGGFLKAGIFETSASLAVSKHHS